MAQVVRKSELGSELVKTLRDINTQIAHVEDTAHSQGVTPYVLKDYHGQLLLAPLLVAKAHVLHAIALINEKGK